MAIFEVTLRNLSCTMLVKADRCEESHGALIFYGKTPTPRSGLHSVVAAYAAGEWLQARTSSIDESIFGEG